MPICFYHNADLDGVCSAAIIKKRFSNCELYGINYGDEFPWEMVVGGDVYMVDFSLESRSDMIMVKDKSRDFIWIDHHVSSINEMDGVDINGIRDVNYSACELVWRYFYNDQYPVPNAVFYLGRYDVWDKSLEETLFFQYGMRLKGLSPESEEWDLLLNCSSHYKRRDDLIVDIIKNGKLIIEYQRQQDMIYAKTCCFDTFILGPNEVKYKCLAINKMMSNSFLFESVWDGFNYDVMMTFGFRKGKWYLSLYTDRDDIDCSVLAKFYNGGGHKKASGFICDNIDLKPDSISYFSR